jgi:predicted metalloprotease with PDZ domain
MRSAADVRALRKSAASHCESLGRILGPFPGENIRILVSREGRHRGVSGEARGASLVLAAAPGAPVREIEQVLAHELAHVFAPARFAPDARYAEEGFADYFAQLARTDLSPFADSERLDALAQNLEVWISSSRRARFSLAEASARFPEDPQAREITYAGGHVLAFLLDEALENQGGLADLWRDLAGPERVSSARLREEVARRGGPEAVFLFDRLVGEPADPSVVENFLPSLEVVSDSTLDRRLGLRFAPGARPVVAEVTPGGAAAKAGVLAGDVVESFDGTPVRTVSDVLRRRDASRASEFDVVVRRGEERLALTGAFETVPRFWIRRRAPANGE